MDSTRDAVGQLVVLVDSYKVVYKGRLVGGGILHVTAMHYNTCLLSTCITLIILFMCYSVK